jgi:threonine aldolase
LFLVALASWASALAASTTTPRSAAGTPIIKLQQPHHVLSPGETLRQLAEQCDELGITDWDSYGDFHLTAENSFLRRFEAELAHEFQKEDAVFMPSGVMAQSIALLVHSKTKRKKRFICHATSHLLLHEQEGFSELCEMEAISLPRSAVGTGFGAQPLLFEHVEELLRTENLKEISTLLLELPHRELGGKLTPWEDILRMRQLTEGLGIAFHCDGARIFEATAGYAKTVAELAEPFESLYISFYKGLGGMSGAMLLGSKEFCDEARVWLRRFGGNLYTLLPYAVSAWSGFRNNGQLSTAEMRRMSFSDKKNKLLRISEAMSRSKPIASVLMLEPTIPQVNMVHCYLRMAVEDAERNRDKIEDELGVSIFQRLRPIAESEVAAYTKGFKCRFELSIGEANGSISDDLWIGAWERFAELFGEQQRTSQL